MHRLKLLTSLALLMVLASGSANAFTKTIGKGYCSLRHPVTLFTESDRNRHWTCESQHIIQQQDGGSDYDNTIWISLHEHDYLDRVGPDRPWEKERPWLNWGDKNAERAYMMGTYARGFHFIVYDHKRNGMPTLITWDGASHFIYLVGSVSNFITKEMTFIGHHWERYKHDGETQFIDAIIGVVIDLVEVSIGVMYSVFGIFIGTLFNPIDTLFNIPAGISLSFETLVEGIANTLSDVLSLVTLGYIQL